MALNPIPRPDLQLGTGNPAPVDGIVLDNRPAGNAYAVSFRDTHITGGPNVEPIFLRNTNGGLQIGPGGYMPPGPRPSVEIASGGSITGNIAVCVRKFNSVENRYSDFSPQFPQPGEQAAVNINEDDPPTPNTSNPTVTASQYVGIMGYTATADAIRFVSAPLPVFNDDRTIFLESVKFYARFIGETQEGVFTVQLYTTNDDMTPNTAVATSKVTVNVGNLSTGDKDDNLGFSEVVVNFPQRLQINGTRYCLVFFGGDPDSANTADGQSYDAVNGLVQLRGADEQPSKDINLPVSVRNVSGSTSTFGPGFNGASAPTTTQISGATVEAPFPAVVSMKGYSGRVAAVLGPNRTSTARTNTFGNPTLENVQTDQYIYQLAWLFTTGPKNANTAAYELSGDPIPDARKESVSMKIVDQSIILAGANARYRVFDFAFTTDDATGVTKFTFIVYSDIATRKPKAYIITTTQENPGPFSGMTSDDIASGDPVFIPTNFLVSPENFNDQYVLFYDSTRYKYYKSTDAGANWAAVANGPTMADDDNSFVLNDDDTRIVGIGRRLTGSAAGTAIRVWDAASFSGTAVTTINVTSSGLWPPGGEDVRLGKLWINEISQVVYASYRLDSTDPAGCFPRLAAYRLDLPGQIGGAGFSMVAYKSGEPIREELLNGSSSNHIMSVSSVNRGGSFDAEVYVATRKAVMRGYQPQGSIDGEAALSTDDFQWYQNGPTEEPDDVLVNNVPSTEYVAGALVGGSGRVYVTGVSQRLKWGAPLKYEQNSNEFATTILFRTFYRDNVYNNPILNPTFDTPNVETIWRKSWVKSFAGTWADSRVDVVVTAVTSVGQQVGSTPQDPAGDSTTVGSRLSSKRIELTDQKLVLRNLAAYNVDAQFEDYDQLQILINADEMNGTWRIAKTIGLSETETEVDVDLTSLVQTEEVIPFQNLPFPGCRNMVAVDFGGSQNLVGYGLAGFSSVKNGPFITRCGISYINYVRIGDSNSTSPVGANFSGMVFAKRSGETWLQGLQGIDISGDYDVNGSYATVYQADPTVYETVKDDFGNTRYIPLGGIPVSRGLIQVQNGVAILTGGVNLPTLNQGQPQTDDSGAGTGYWIEFRRRVFATVKKGSDLVTLSYADGSPAYVADRWMIQHEFAVQGLDGKGLVWRAEPLSPAVESQYPTRQFFPSNVLRLFIPWNGQDGTGDFTLIPDNTSLFFGGSYPNDFTTTCVKTVLRSPALRNPIVAIGKCRSFFVAICGAEQIMVLQSGGIFIPGTLPDYAGYDVSLDVSVSIGDTSHTCVSSSTTNDADGNIYWKGSGEKVFRFNSTSVEPVSDMISGEYFRRMDEGALRTATITQTPGELYSQGVQIAGMALKNDYRSFHWHQVTYRNYYDLDGDGAPVDTTVTFQDVRLLNEQRSVFYPNRRSWIRQEGVGEIDVATSVVTTTGASRLMVLASGRIALYATPSIEDSESADYAYTTLRVDQQSWYYQNVPAQQFTEAGGDEFLPTVIFTASQMRYPPYRALPFLASGMVIYKLPTTFSTSTQIEKAEVICTTDFPLDLDDPQTAVLGTGDGAEDAFTGTIDETLTPIRAATMEVTYTSGGVTKTFSDSGGSFTGDVDPGGTIDYETGAYSFTTSFVPDDATTIDAAFQRNPTFALSIRPRTDWTIEADATYYLVFCAKPWKIQLPSIQAKSPYTWVSMQSLNADVDTSNPDWAAPYPFIQLIQNTRSRPGYDVETATLRNNLADSTLQNQYFDNLVVTGEMGHEFMVTLSGFAAPDSDLLFSPITLRYTEDGK